MHPVRRKRLIAVAFLLVGVGVTVMLVMRALNENINLFYPPVEVVSGKAPVGPRIRAGGMVKDGSLQRAPDGLDIRFIVTDLQRVGFYGRVFRHPAGPVSGRKRRAGDGTARRGRCLQGG